jgi:hypothetical protein
MSTPIFKINILLNVVVVVLSGSVYRLGPRG